MAPPPTRTTEQARQEQEAMGDAWVLLIGGLFAITAAALHRLGR